MFILGTASVLVFVTPETVDLIGPIPQVLSLGFGPVGWVSTLISITIFRRGGETNRFDEHLFRRQYSFADGGRLGRSTAGLVRAPA